jgi:hypothetical protein
MDGGSTGTKQRFPLFDLLASTHRGKLYLEMNAEYTLEAKSISGQWPK